jgi:dTDP-4-dehydrorhamnose reductase
VYQVIDALRAASHFAAAVDLVGTPTWTRDLAQVLLRLTLGGHSGLWHAGGEEYVSRYELATRAAKAFGLPLEFVTPTMSGEGDGVSRPKSAGLRNDRLHATGLVRMTPLDAALERLATHEVYL